MLEAILFQDRPFERRHGLAFADDVQRHALAHFAFSVTIGDDGLIAVRVHIDEARRNHVSLGGDGALPRFRTDFSDRCDPALLDRHVAIKPWISCAIDKSAAVNNKVELSHAASSLAVSRAYITQSSMRQDRSAIMR